MFRLAKSGKKVLYIATKAPESLPLPIDDEYDDPMYRDILKNTTFSYSTDATQLIKFFLDLREYQPKPEVIIVDFLHTFFEYFYALDIDASLHTNFIECHMLMTAALYSAVDTFCNSATTKNFISIVCIDPQCHNVYKKFVQTFIDLYYYKEGAILSFDDLMEKISV